MQASLDLSHANISQCLATLSSLNLTADKEITISYIQHENQVIPHGGNNLTTSKTPAVSLNPKLNRGFSQHQGTVGHKLSSESVTGQCSILIEAPPGKVLSILFLNQTCSRDNQVRVQDFHDGWSTALDGCSPWKAPGYDVTTSNKSAVVEIDIHNLFSFFKLKVHIKTLVVRMPAGIITRYVSPVLGYIQTLGWHPFTRTFGGNIRGTVTVMVPWNRVTLISAVYLHFDYSQARGISLLTDRKRRWYNSYRSNGLPGEVLQANLTKFTIEPNNVYIYFFVGGRVLFSFHQRHPDGLWNCSVPYWPDFRQHFACNNKTDCAGREDEMRCPDTSCQQGGTLVNDICYILLPLSKPKITWHHANTACKQRGTALASFPTVNSWYHFHLILKSPGLSRNDVIYIGLQSPDVKYSHMYRYSIKWHNGSICHYMAFMLKNNPPFCVIYAFRTLVTESCEYRSTYPTFALCQTMPSPVVSVSREKNEKMWHTSNKQVQPKLKNRHKEPFPFSSISCPGLHLTQTFLACDDFSACWRDCDVSSSDVNFTADNRVTPLSVDLQGMLLKAMFPCRNGASSVPYSLVCNHLQDCADNSDEDFCVFLPCSAASQYKCANGQCLSFRYYCDEIVQCLDESDEVNCVPRQYERLDVIVRERPPAVADFDGRGFVVYKPLTIGRDNSAVVCPDTHVFCRRNAYCLPVYIRCNGLLDCWDHEDEADCDSYTCPGLYRCRGLLNTCLHPDHMCDGWPQCPQHDDELFCNLTCPVNCTCLGHAFTCKSEIHAEQFSPLRYLDASGTKVQPGHLLNNTMLVYLSLAKCDLRHLDNLTLPNLLNLDLNDNRFSVVTVTDLNLMKNLKNLSLVRNPLSNLFSGNYSSGFLVHKHILHVDVAGVKLTVLNITNNLPFPNLLSLNLSESGVTRLFGDGFQSLTSLRIIDLRGCPMTEFPRRVFENLRNLRLVFADNFKLCCEASLPRSFNVDNCHAPFNEISSCVALLRADVYRVCLSVLAALALNGNLGCFFLRSFSLTGRGKTGFNVFVTHLCVSDFLMGVYMAIIGVADRLYLGRYLWNDGRWRHSAACQVAGVLSLLSSEVSALIICLITLDRFLVIRFPFSRFRFSSFSAQIASILTWAIGVVLAIVPVTAYRHFYGQTGICVPLPFTRKDFAGDRYAFGVMIILNLVVFLIIATGQISMYMSMMTNTMSSINTTRKSRDLIVARRLITVVVSDFLCWFPLGLLGVLAAQGVPVPGEVNVAMAIFVLPLNSALNPFLYTLNVIQEKRRRAAELKLLKLIMDRGMKENEHGNT